MVLLVSKSEVKSDLKIIPDLTDLKVKGGEMILDLFLILAKLYYTVLQSYNSNYS